MLKTLLKVYNNTEGKNHQLIKIGHKTTRKKTKLFFSCLFPLFGLLLCQHKSLPMSISPFWATFMST